MIDINEPNYKYYARIKSIPGNEAQKLLAMFELRDKEFSDQAEFDKLFEIEMKLARNMLVQAIDNGELNYNNDEDPYIDIKDGFWLVLNKINISTIKFISWAAELEYNLPEELAKLVNKAECSSNDNSQDTPGEDEAQKPIETSEADESKPDKPSNEVIDESVPDLASPATDRSAPKNKGGRPKGYLYEVIEHVYNNLGKHGKSELSKLRRVREFIIFTKQMATKGNDYTDEYVMERIKSIKVPEEGDCTITLEDKVTLRGLNELTEKPGKASYTNNDVAKILTKLRKNNQ